MKRFLLAGAAVLMAASASFAQQPPPPPPPAPPAADAAGNPGGPPPPPPPLRHGPAEMGPGPDGMRGPPPPPPSKGAHFRIEDGERRIDLKCADDEPMKACADLLMQVIDKLND